MKKQLLISIFVFLNLLTYAQCGLVISTRADGTKTFATIPKMIGHNNKNIQAGLSLESNNSSDFIGLTLRFKYHAVKLKDEIYVTLMNNKVIIAKLINCTTTNLGGSEVSLGIYQLSETDLNNLGASEIKKIKFTFVTNISEEVLVSANSDCLKSVINCLTK